jgi:Ca2+-binding RTX toxin-like protein
LANNTEIVIVRNGVVIAELDNIEEIVIDGRGGGDTFSMRGNFNGTSLAMSTVTLLGSGEDDTVDISELASAHRIVFRSNGGNDVIVGKLRPQDVVHLQEGKTIANYELTKNANGTSTITTEGHSVTFDTVAGLPTFVAGDSANTGGNNGGGNGGGGNGGGGNGGGGKGGKDDDKGRDDNDKDRDDDHKDREPGRGDHGKDETPAPGNTVFGGEEADSITTGNLNDVVFGYGGNDRISTGGGDDLIYGGEGHDTILSGDGNDIVFGGEGNDHIIAGAGNDLIYAGQGNDHAFGDDGDDTFVAEENDGDDLYFGGAGSDTLDMSSITADIKVVLSSTGAGSSKSSQTGYDTLYSIENVRTGSGADTIVASEAVNIMDGGAGNDSFVFGSVLAAHQDVILGFDAGDKIDLRGIDANTAACGDQAFNFLAAGRSFTGAGQELLVRWDTDDQGRDVTIVQGDVNSDGNADFQINIIGSHTLDANHFYL